jgi:hypothetical protein
MVKKLVRPKKPKRPKVRPDTPKIPPKRPKPLKKKPRKSVDELAWYLGRNTLIADAIRWSGQSNPTPNVWYRYPNWTAAMKGDLARMYYNIRGRRFPRLGPGGRRPVLTTLSATPTPSAFDTVGLGIIFDNAIAWQYFLAYIAHSLMIEIFQLVPWSLNDLTEAQRNEVLAPIGLFEYFPQSSDYRLEYAATPGDPLNVSQFLFSNSLIAGTQRETIGRLLQWSVRMRHFYGTYNPATALAHWGYNGWPPVERVIAGTTHPQNGFENWSGGCGAMVSFLKIVLRTVNIPVEKASADGHSTPHFMVEDLYLSHGDDPYGSIMKTTSPPIPIDELFLDRTAYDAWFGPAVAPAQQALNVGRRVFDLGVRYLPNSWLKLRCQDIAQGVTNDAASAVYTQDLSRFYTVAQLQALNFWPRLDAKIAAMGGCANIP